MNKMSFIAVSVLMMISTSSAFADSCFDIEAAILTSEANIAQMTKEISSLVEANMQIQADVINNARDRKDDSMILGNGQPHLREVSFQLMKSQANLQESLRREQAKLDLLNAEKCPGSEKSEQLIIFEQVKTKKKRG